MLSTNRRYSRKGIFFPLSFVDVVVVLGIPGNSQTSGNLRYDANLSGS